MGALVLGGFALALAIFLLRRFAGADPKALVKGMRISGAGVLALVAIGLAALDRVALAGLVGSMAWGLFTGGHVWPGGWPHPGRHGASPGSSDTKSRVQTEWLDMELEHATGAMTGRVRKGDFQGDLESLSCDCGLSLFRRLEGVDSASARLLEAYLDRRFGPRWRQSESSAEPVSGGMTRKEALAILEVADTA